MYCPLKHAFSKGLKNIHILYFSFEISAEILLAKLLSLYIYDKHKISISYEEILSLTKPITEENYKLVQEARGWLEEVEDIIEIIDTQMESGSVYHTIKKWCLKYGKIRTTEVKGFPMETYEEYDPNHYLIVIIDHIRLLKQKQPSIREEIELCCKYLISLRNKFRLRITIVQQLNRNSKSMDRKLNGYEMLALDDLSDSGAPAQASEQVIGIFFPHREKIATCEGYPVNKILKDRLRILQIMKNRFGMSDKVIGVGFYGEIGYWVEMPKPEDISNYSRYLSLETVNNKEDIKKEEEIQTTYTFNV